MSLRHLLALGLAALLVGIGASSSRAFQAPDSPPLPNLDRRKPANAAAAVPTSDQAAAARRLETRVPHLRVNFDALTGSPRVLGSTTAFLTQPAASGKKPPGSIPAATAASDPDGPLKAFLRENRDLFGHGPEALDSARTNREFVTPHNGLHTKVWQQELDGIPIFEALLIAHTTRQGELVSVSSHFVPDPAAAADRGCPDRPALLVSPPVAALTALAFAVRSVGGTMVEVDAGRIGQVEAGPEQRQRFVAGALKGEAVCQLIWLPLDKGTLRLCWDTRFTSRTRGEMFRALVDAQSGELMERHSLTAHLTDASYRVFTGNSPGPLLPTLAAPMTNQPPLVARSLVTWPALDTNASPAGWINDGGNETLGNNVDAHLDRNGDDLPDLPRPQGTPYRVFDFPLDLAQAPTAYGDAAVTELFYWCNWMHDTLYGLGFTEAAGNFQNDNFSRGGLGGDAVQADAQDGASLNNSDMTTPPDGSPPRLQMYLYNGPTPFRDGDLDTDVVLHEYTHGLSARRVGGGGGLYELQSQGLAEGWSDFYALALQSGPGDDVNAAYAFAAYTGYRFGGLEENYYFGIRRYPYTTDLSRDPVTFKDIDPAQAGPHPGVPLSSRFSPFRAADADEVHNQGEIWCAALWEARASLILKYGFAAGNPLILRLVTDGMNLAPANPNFLEARDALLQADLVDNAGTNQPELWSAFAKRGLGFSAVSPSSVTANGVIEAFDRPDDLFLTPDTAFVSSGPTGGAFAPATLSLTLTNLGTNALAWQAGLSGARFTLAPSGGTLMPASATNVVLALAPGAASLPAGIYDDTAGVTNLASGNVLARFCRLRIGQPDYLTALLASASNSLAYQSFTFTPDESSNAYSVCRQDITALPTDITGGADVNLGDDDSIQVTLSGTNSWSLFGYRTNVFYLGSNGYLTLDQGDTAWKASLATHFALRRVSALLDDLYPPAGGSISWKELTNRVAITFQSIRRYGSPSGPNTFQIELFFDGRIRLSYLAISDLAAVVGLSNGQGIPLGFASSDFSAFPACPLPLALTLPGAATEGDGLLAVQGQVNIPVALATNLAVSLVSVDAARVAVPPSTILLAGQTNAGFDVTVLDDGVLDGTQPAAVNAAAPGYLPAATTMTIYDKQTATLSVALPAVVLENGGATQGVLQVSAPPVRDVSVALLSSNTNKLSVPPGAVLPAGQTSVVFSVTLVDNLQIDGPQAVTITASVRNWTDGTAVVTVLDNETLNLVVTLPAQATEGDGTLTNAGSVRLSGTLATNLVVSLTSDDLSELIVPATTTILAGQISSSFDLTVVEDWDVDGTQRVVVAASAPGFTNGTAAMLILDSDVPVAPTNPSPPDLASNVAANTALAWSGGRLETTNDVYLGTNPAPGPAEWVGTTTGTNWTPPLLAPNTLYYWQIVARRGGATRGPVWQFTTRGVDHLDCDPVASPQFAGQPFNLTLTARDEFGQAVTNFAGAASLSGFNGPTNPSLFRADFENGGLSDWTAGAGNYLEVVTNQTAAGGSNSLTLIGGAGGQFDGLAHALANLQPARIKFSIRASATNVTGGCFAVGSAAALTNTAVLFCLRNDGTMGLEEAVAGWHGTPDSAGRWRQITLDFDWILKRVDYFVDGVLIEAGIPFRNNVEGLSVLSLYNSDSTQAWWDEIEFLAQRPPASVAIAPTNGFVFVGGVCTASLTVAEPVASLYLVADDGAGHTGASGPTTVLIPNDLSLTAVAAPSPVASGALLNYTVTVFNPGPAAATGVLLTNILPADVTFVSAAVSQGTWIRTGRTVVADLGSLSGAAAATLNLAVIPTGSGWVTNLASVTRSEPDSIPTNNFAASLTPVLPVSGLLAFASATNLFLPDIGPGLPYPSTNVVSGVSGSVARVTITLSDLSHAQPAGLSFLLVGPSGANVMLLSGAGGSNAVNHVSLQFADAAPGTLPQSEPLASGSYQPTQYPPAATLPFPAPLGPFGSTLSAFEGVDPNGVWQLFAFDGVSGGAGAVSGGWSLQLTVAATNAAAPRILDPAWNAGQFGFHFQTEPGHNYSVEFKADFADPLWELLETVAGDGTDKGIMDWNASTPTRFYRLRVQ